jgi:hypothetical protein
LRNRYTRVVAKSVPKRDLCHFGSKRLTKVEILSLLGLNIGVLWEKATALLAKQREMPKTSL